MISPQKFLNLPTQSRLRKLWRMACELEIALRDPEDRAGEAAAILDFLQVMSTAGTAGLPAGLLADFVGVEVGPDDRLRAANDLRHALAAIVGKEAAEWDLLPPKLTGNGQRHTLPAGACRIVYCDSIRSPFNAGSIFRTASAFNFDLVMLSPDCPEPEHPRFLRSAMGALDYLPWKRGELTELLAETGLPVFALELGGDSYGCFAFPQAGIVVLGSEELGVRPQILDRCRSSLGIVSIPLPGPKASLNVGVSFGILAAAWCGGGG